MNELELYYLIPLAFILAVIPLIVFLKVVPLQGIVKDNWIQDINYDFFSYYKAQALKISTIAAIIMFVICKQTNRLEIKKTKVYIPMGIYSLMVVLSTVFSKYKGVALNGFPDRYEGMWVLLCYMAILFITVNMVQTEKHIKFLLSALAFSTVVIGTIGVFQFLGYDLFNSDIGKKLILPSKYEFLAPDIRFQFEHTNAIYSTLQNTNYVGSFMALVLPVVATYMILSINVKKKLYFALGSIFLFFILVASRSRGGLIGIVVALLLLLVFLREQVNKNKKVLLAVSFFLISIILIVNTLSGGLIVRRIKLILPQSQTTAIYALTNMEINDNIIKMQFKDATIVVRNGDEQLQFLDENGSDIPVVINDNKINFTDNIFSRHVFELRFSNNNYYLYYKNLDISFLMSDEGFRLMNDKNIPVVIEDIESWGFAGNERLGSSRGYIWSRTLPLLKQTMIMGEGTDTFAIVFPQNDYIGKLLAFGRIDYIVDKPHNMYLQIAVNTGIISLLALMYMIIKYLYKSASIYFRASFARLHEVTGIGVMIAIFAYLVTALFNDSLVSVAPVFWIILGLGISINYNCEQKSIS